MYDTETQPIPRNMNFDEIIRYMAWQDGHISHTERGAIAWRIADAAMQHAKDDPELHDKLHGILRAELDALPAWDDYDPAINLIYFAKFGERQETTRELVRGRLESSKHQVDDITQQMEDYIRILQAHRPKNRASISDAWYKAARLVGIVSDAITSAGSALSEVNASKSLLEDDEIKALATGLLDAVDRLVDLDRGYVERVRDLMITD